MSDSEPAASDGQPEPDPPGNGGGSLSRLRMLLRLLRRSQFVGIAEHQGAAADQLKAAVDRGPPRMDRPGQMRRQGENGRLDGVDEVPRQQRRHDLLVSCCLCCRGHSNRNREARSASRAARGMSKRVWHGVSVLSYRQSAWQKVYYTPITPTPLSPLLLRGELVRPSVPRLALLPPGLKPGGSFFPACLLLEVA